MDREQEEKNNAIVQQIYDRLQDIQLQQRAILNNIPDMVWLKDKESRFVEVNEAFGAACGLAPDDVKGKTDLDIWPRELAQSYRADDREVMTTKKRKRIEERLADKQGQIQWLETVKTPVFDNKGVVVGTTGIARDITERKRIEDRLKEIRAELEIRVKVRTVELSRANEKLRKEISERKKSDEALRISEERFRTVADFTYDWEYWQGADNRMIYVSPSCKRITGYSAKEFMDDPDLIEKIVHPDDIVSLRKKTNDAVDNCSKLEVDFRIIDRSGSIHWLSHVCIPVYGKDGKLLGRRASNRDITEKKNYERELQIYREKLELLVSHRTKALELEVESRKAAQQQANALRQQLEFILKATKTELVITDKDF
ncbi:MAG: PAS domain S-box protein, partial [Candidatus Omnitrophica bacterium]|nr:PAS domain S-box protein [Candidatus Omnitrophota bacterium]